MHYKCVNTKCPQKYLGLEDVMESIHKELCNIFSSATVVRVVKRSLGWAGHVVLMEKQEMYIFLDGESSWKTIIWRTV
jgi:hypothetical protein